MDEYLDRLGYCRGCTDAQLRNVYAQEVDRAERHGPASEIGAEAMTFVLAACEEAARRGLDLGS